MQNAYFRLILGFLGGRVNSFDPKRFDNVEDAKEHHRVEYKERKKNDGYDEYWNNKPLVIQKITEELVVDERVDKDE